MNLVEDFPRYLFTKKVSQYSRKIKEIIAKYRKDYFSQRKTENTVDKFFSESCLTPFSVRVHAFSINFFLIDRLNVALQNCFCRFSLRWNMRKLEEKQKGGRNLWNTLYVLMKKIVFVLIVKKSNLLLFDSIK